MRINKGRIVPFRATQKGAAARDDKGRHRARTLCFPDVVPLIVWTRPCLLLQCVDTMRCDCSCTKARAHPSRKGDAAFVIPLREEANEDGTLFQSGVVSFSGPMFFVTHSRSIFSSEMEANRPCRRAACEEGHRIEICASSVRRETRQYLKNVGGA